MPSYNVLRNFNRPDKIVLSTVKYGKSQTWKAWAVNTNVDQTIYPKNMRLKWKQKYPSTS
jgi:hypothetical protein